MSKLNIYNIQSETTNEQSATYDAVIVGAGIAGLYTGCQLRKKGFKCSIIESHYVPGGCVQGFRRKGYYFDAGAHLIGSTKPKALLHKLLHAVDVEYPFININPVDRIHFPEDTIDVPLGIDEYINYLSRRFPDESDALRNFFNKMEIVARYCGRQHVADKYGPMTYDSMLRGYLRNEQLIEILGAQWGFLGETPKEVSALAMSIMLVGYIRDGASYAKGGAQSFCNALARKFKELGGHLYMSTNVKSAYAEGKNIKWLETDKLGKVVGKFYIWTPNPSQLLDACSDLSGVEPQVMHKIRLLRQSINVYSLFLGLDISSHKCKAISGWHYLKDPLNRGNTNATWTYLFSPSYYDDSLAPKHKSTLVVSLIYPDNFLEKITQEERRKQLRELTIDFLLKFFPDIKSKIEIIEDGLPETFEKYTKNPRGSIYGWAPRADNYWDRKFLAENKIFDNVILAGHWTMPGPGVPAVAMSGYLAANHLAKLFTLNNNQQGISHAI